MYSTDRNFLLLCWSLAMLSMSGVAHTEVHEIVHSFDLNPRNPRAGKLVLRPDGYFWGTTERGGAHDLGTVFKVKPDGSDWQTVQSFSGSLPGNKGSLPAHGLVADDDGTLWGTTPITGSTYDGKGTVFKIDPNTKILTTVIEFDWGSVHKGRVPEGLLNHKGYIWGITSSGGVRSVGTVFKLDPKTGILTTVVEFLDDALGRVPNGSLIADLDGQHLWGVNGDGGLSGAGTIFRLNAENGTITRAYAFIADGSSSAPQYPGGPLVQTPDGVLWGGAGGGPLGDGTIFKFTPITGALSKVIEFTRAGASNRGAHPGGGLTWGPAGFLWGVTIEGGTEDGGTLYKLNKNSGALTTVKEFGGSGIGLAPRGELASDGAGNFFGMFSGRKRSWEETSEGGVFKVNTTTNGVVKLARFSEYVALNRGRFPTGDLESDDSGFLWLPTIGGGVLGKGTVMKFHSTSSPEIVLEFVGGNSLQGNPPVALTNDGNGYLWGCAGGGGAFGYGEIFKVNATTGVYTHVLNFNHSVAPNKGSFPNAKLVSDGKGFLWGTTRDGGFGYGTVFKVDTLTGVLTTVVNFTWDSPPSFGAIPSGLMFDGVDSLWGVTGAGGTTSRLHGTLYKINAITGAHTTVVQFTGQGGSYRGSQPYGRLVMDESGWLWGTTTAGGANSWGTAFKFNPATGAFTTLVEFARSGVPSGGNPRTALVKNGSYFWGTTSEGGNYDHGTVFKIHESTGEFSTVKLFSGPGIESWAGSSPGGLVKHSDGHIYGTTIRGGPGGGGTVYRLHFGPTSVTLPAESLTISAATLKGTVNPNNDGISTVAFDYGTDPALGERTRIDLNSIPNANVLTELSTSLIDLLPNTIYYYRIVAQNSGNPNEQRGAIRSFKTLSRFEDWKRQELGDPNAADLGDPDGDGVVTLAEYGLNRHQKEPEASSPAAFRHMDPEGERLHIFVERNPRHNDAIVDVQCSEGMSGPWITIAASVHGAPFTGIGYVGGDDASLEPKIVEIRDIKNIADGPMRFLRVKVTN